jgi:hypothetical protein
MRAGMENPSGVARASAGSPESARDPARTATKRPLILFS